MYKYVCLFTSNLMVTDHVIEYAGQNVNPRTQGVLTLSKYLHILGCSRSGMVLIVVRLQFTYNQH